jgi:hypothetical protein
MSPTEQITSPAVFGYFWPFTSPFGKSTGENLQSLCVIILGLIMQEIIPTLIDIELYLIDWRPTDYLLKAEIIK